MKNLILFLFVVSIFFACDTAFIDTELTECQSELLTTKNDLANKDNLLATCNAALIACELQGETDGENYTVKTEAVTAYLVNVQTKITEAEKALFNLNTIEDQDVNEAIRATTENLFFLKGQRKAIGDIFNIQVQN